MSAAKFPASSSSNLNSGLASTLLKVALPLILVGSPKLWSTVSVPIGVLPACPATTCANGFLPPKPSVEIVEMEVEQKAILFIKEFSELKSGDTPAKIGAAYGEIGAFIGANELTVVGMPLTITNDFSMEKMHPR